MKKVRRINSKYIIIGEAGLCLLLFFIYFLRQSGIIQETMVRPQEEKKIALTFDDDVIIGLSQEISYKEAVSMI